MPAVESKDVWKVYGNGVEALRGVSFSVGRGMLVALLGRNGAGKTTWVRIASTQLLPSRGTVEVMGLDVVSSPWSVREVISMIPQEGFPNDLLTPYEFVSSYLLIRGYSRSEAKERTHEVFRALELEECANVVISNLSGGMKRRVMVAAVLASGSEVMFLDEPTTGLDPLARRSVWRALKAFKREGVTMLLTTHYMDEAESLADLIVMIHRGRIVFVGSVEEAKRVVGRPLKVEVYGGVELGGYEGVKLKDMTIFYVDEGEAEEVVRRVVVKGLEATVKPTSLEDSFIRLTGEVIEERSL
ncbi:MAG: ABC transporter ATP-binding protein [Thermoprotei archaeon]|nr:MAG: ABC transporter ATP-binding protein [Thermoprotei archaeon]